jgi:hypothetical protein
LYIVTGLAESATTMLHAISKPAGRHLPSNKICEQMKKKDSQVCELQYDVPIDLKTVSKKMRVKTLKKILQDQFNDECKGCLEKVRGAVSRLPLTWHSGPAVMFPNLFL